MENKIRKKIAIDFDGVIHSYTSKWISPAIISDPPTVGAFNFIEKILEDYDVVIFSTRATANGRLAIKKWLSKYGMSKSLISKIEITNIKPHAVIYLDDRAWQFNGAFPSVEEINVFKPCNKQ